MAEIGSTLLFLALIGASLFVLARTIAGNWERMMAALDGRLVTHPADERVLAVTMCRPIDLPYVARRMGRTAAVDAPRAPGAGRRKAA